MCPKSLKNTRRAPRATILHEFFQRLFRHRDASGVTPLGDCAAGGRCAVGAGGLQWHGGGDVDRHCVDGHISRLPGGTGVARTADLEPKLHDEGVACEHDGGSREVGQPQRSVGLDDRRAGELYNRHHHGGLQFGRDVYDNGTEHGLALTPVGTSGQALGQVTLNLTLDPANDLSEVPHIETSRPNE